MSARSRFVLFHAQPPFPEAQPLDPLDLRGRVQTAYPGIFISEHWGSTSLYIDGRNGEVSYIWLPTGAAIGNTITTWVTTLHLAGLWGLPMKLFISLVGLVVAMLCVTGVIIWLRKRSARLRSANRKNAKTHVSSTTHQAGTVLTPQTECRSSVLKTLPSKETA